MRKKLIALALTTVAFIGAQAQKSISGTLQKAADNTALPYANVALLRQADSTFVRGTTSDDKGRFSLDGDTVATLLRISAIGYETLFVPVSDSTPGAMVNLGVLSLTEGATTLDAVNITAVRPIYSADGDKNIYNVSEDPSIQGGTAQDALQNAPGVLVDGEGNITLNGKTVNIYINDHESHLSGETLKQYIKTLTADQISSIEVIEYPPAKYGGGGPVINIRTDQKLLRNSYLSFGANGSSEPGVSPFISYTYANEKLRFDTYVRYSGSHEERHRKGSGTMLDSAGAVARQYESVSEGTSFDNNMNFNLNASYEFDTMNSVSAYFTLYPYWSSDEGNEHTTRTDYINGQAYDFSHDNHNDSRYHFVWGYGGISYDHKFDTEGHQISFYLGGDIGGSGSSGSSWEHYTTQTQLDFDQRTEDSSPESSFSVGANYSKPYSENGEVGVNISYSFSPGVSYSLRDTLGADGLYHTDCLRSDTVTGDNHSVSLGLSWRHKWGDFTLSADADLDLSSSANRHSGLPEFDTSVFRVTFLPSVRLSYRTKSMHSFTLSYRPTYQLPSASSLSRYVDYGTDSYSTGNPNLEASYGHDFGLSYNKFFEQGHSVGVYSNYSFNFNSVSSISDPVWSDFFGRVVPFSMPYNAGDSRRGNAYIYGSYRVSALLSFSLNGGISESWYRIMVRPGRMVEDENVSWDARLSMRAKLFNLFWVRLTAHYSSRSHGWSPLSVYEPRWGADASVSADLFDRKLSFYLNFNDIFNTDSWGYSSVNPYNTSTSTSTYNSQYITFGVTLRFGKMDLGDNSREGIQESNGGGKGGK